MYQYPRDRSRSRNRVRFSQRIQPHCRALIIYGMRVNKKVVVSDSLVNLLPSPFQASLVFTSSSLHLYVFASAWSSLGWKNWFPSPWLHLHSIFKWIRVFLKSLLARKPDHRVCGFISTASSPYPHFSFISPWPISWFINLQPSYRCIEFINSWSYSHFSLPRSKQTIRICKHPPSLYYSTYIVGMCWHPCSL